MITFDVGNSEKHHVAFSYSTMTGAVKILVDDKEYSSSRVMFVGHTPFTLQVGDKEKHTVRLELDNPLFFAFRGSDLKVFVDEKLLRQDHIGGSMFMFLFLMLIPIIMVLFFSLGLMLRLGK